MVIFGASGDLTRRKLFPALYELTSQHALPPEFSLIGTASQAMSSDQFRCKMKEAADTFSGGPMEASAWDQLARGLEYLSADFQDLESYRRLASLLIDVDRERGTRGNRVFYLATPPSLYPSIIRGLAAAGLNRSEAGWSRIVIEKPFGRNLESARALNRELGQVFAEDQVYRIDHYLGKETVQNILVSRFSSGIFEPIWNRRYIDSVQITVAEDLGIGARAKYYEESGALRDMLQSHMLQVLALTAMEPPVAFEANAVRDEKVKVLRSIHPLSPGDVERRVVRAQYVEGSISGKRVPGYRSEDGVQPDSTTETFVAAQFAIDNWRWADVPFFLRTGKRLPARLTEITLQFKQPPILLFGRLHDCGVPPTALTVHMQPAEGISLQFGAKEPGSAICVKPVSMNFSYSEAFGVKAADAYQRLLVDCMLGDATLFARRDGVETAWSLVQPIIDAWQSAPPAAIPVYRAGTWGPAEANELLGRSGRTWKEPPAYRASASTP
jgi:glucose-6-phosphate 1-dehydrogenase